jgi:hypothetical protein
VKIITGRTLFIVPERGLEFRQIPVLVCERDGAHGFDVSELSEFERELDGEQRGHIFWLLGWLKFDTCVWIHHSKVGEPSRKIGCEIKR